MRHSTNCQACADLAADSLHGALLGELSASDDVAMKTLYIKQLTVSEKVALVKIARSYAHVASYAYEGLIQEAFERLLRSQLTPAASVRTIDLLAEVVQTLARERFRQARDEPAVTDLPQERRNESCAPRPLAHRAHTPLLPEWLRVGAVDMDEMASEIVALFDDDPPARQMVMRIMEGPINRPCETEHLGKLRTIRRRIEKFYAERVRGSL
jgi:hypothetical protein